LAGAREVAVRVFDRSVRLGRPRRIPHLADAAAGPAFCSAAGVLQRAAFGPREAAPKRPATTRAATQIDPRANVMVKAAAWLRDNL
jgi:cell division protein FtsA